MKCLNDLWICICIWQHTSTWTWLRHQMEILSASLTLYEGNPPATGEGNTPVTSGFPAQRPVTRSFDVFFDARLNKRLNKHSRCWWFETPWRSLWRQCNGFVLCYVLVLTEFIHIVQGCFRRLTHNLPWQNGRHFADNIFKRISLNEDVKIAIQISLGVVLKGLIYNKSALVKIMA